MEDWATNAGTGSTVGSDGAFERFLTAAIATIITIMFSWRLLLENADENGDANTAFQIRQRMLAQGASGGFDLPDPEHQGKNSGSRRPNTPREPTAVIGPRSHLTPGHDVMECKHGSQSHSSLSALPVNNRPPMDRDEARPTPVGGSSEGGVHDSEEGADDRPTWGYDSWEDDTYWNIHTRRKPRDFMSSNTRTKSESSDQSCTGGSDSSDVDGGGVAPTSEGEDDQYVNREYRSIVENEEYTNMMEEKNSDSDSSESDEGEYEPPMMDSDSDDDGNYSNPLEPIIEEDSDDMCVSEEDSNDDSDEEGKETSNENDIICAQNDAVTEPDCESNLLTVNEGDCDENLKLDDSLCKIKDTDSSGEIDGAQLSVQVDRTDVGLPGCVIQPKLNSRDLSSSADTYVVPGADDTKASSDHVALFTSVREGPKAVIVDVIDGEGSQLGDREHCMNERHIPNLDVNKYNDTDLDVNPPADDSSVPQSPVRTCAVEDLCDGYISDESCSSASVVTVVSVDYDDDDDDDVEDVNQHRQHNLMLRGPAVDREQVNYQGNHRTNASFSDEDDNASDSNSEECLDGNEECVEKSDSVIHIPQLVESEWGELESNNNSNTSVGLNNAVTDIDLIQEDNATKTHEFCYGDFITEIKATSEDKLSPTVKVHETSDPGLISEDRPTITDIAGVPGTDGEGTVDTIETNSGKGNNPLMDEDMFTLSQLASIPEEGEEHGVSDDYPHNSREPDKSDTVCDRETVSVQLQQEHVNEVLESVAMNNAERRNVSVINYQSVDDDDDDLQIATTPFDKDPDDVPRFQNISTNIQDYVNSSDDDVEPREYNPYDDEFQFGHDSDDDSFFLVLGDQNHLRKLDTVTNLDALGLNAATDGYDVQPGADGKSVVFTKTEEIYTDHQVRYFTEDRIPCTSASASSHSIVHDEGDPQEHVTGSNDIPNGITEDVVMETESPCVMNGVNDVYGIEGEDTEPDTVNLSTCVNSGNVLSGIGYDESKGSNHGDLLYDNEQLQHLHEVSTSLENTREMSDNDRTSDSHSDLSSADMTGSGEVRMRGLQESLMEQSSRESLNEVLHIDEEQDSGIQCNSFSPNQSQNSPVSRLLGADSNVGDKSCVHLHRNNVQNASGDCEDNSGVELFINESNLYTEQSRQVHVPVLPGSGIDGGTNRTVDSIGKLNADECLSNMSKETVIDHTSISPIKQYKRTVSDDDEIVYSTHTKKTIVDDSLPSMQPKETAIDDILPSEYSNETVNDDILAPKETVIDDILPSKETVIDDILPPMETAFDDAPISKHLAKTAIDDTLSSKCSLETAIDDISPSTHSKETAIDDILPSKETAIDDFLPSKHSKETAIDDGLPSKETAIDDFLPSKHSKETAIDDVLPSKETAIDDFVPSKHSKETAIDDILPSKETAIDDFLPSKHSKETAIDDVLPSKEIAIDDFVPSKHSKETAIDDVLPSKETAIDDFVPSKHSKETAIDDILPSKETAIDDFVPSKETAIDDILPSKETAIDDFLPSKHSKETAIDDVSPPKETVIDDVSHPKETAIDDISPSKRSKDTAIDDISPSIHWRETAIADIVAVKHSKETNIDDISPIGTTNNTATMSPSTETVIDYVTPPWAVKARDGTKGKTMLIDDVPSLPTNISVKHEAVRPEVIHPNTLDEFESAIVPCIEQYTKSVNSPTKVQPDVEHVASVPKSGKQEKESKSSEKYKNIPIVPRYGWVVRTSVVSPSGLKGIKGKISKQQERSRMRPPRPYQSVLTEPVLLNPSAPIIRMPDPKPMPVIRQKIMSSRHRFLSADNLTDNVSEQFEHYKSMSKTPTKQRIYTRRETTPAQKTRRILSFERIDSIGGMYSSRYNNEDSVERPTIDSLHKDCIFSPHKHKEIMATAESIDQLHEPLLSYGSVSSLVETDIDSGETYETFFLHETDVDMFGFQHIPLNRTASMSDMMTSRAQEGQKVKKGRFADRNMPKSKSLMALETDIDEEVEGDGSLKRVPSIHELRVAKSLQKLNVPDWYKKSSVSRSGSTYSLLSERRDSTSTLNSIGYAMSTTSCPCPSISPTTGAVVIKTRVTPSSANRFLRAPKLPVTPEKSPLPHTNFRLPSDRLRNKEKSKELMPIPVVPFSQLRLMFETGKKKTSTPVKKTPSTKSQKSPLSSPDEVDRPVASSPTSAAPPPGVSATEEDHPPINGTSNSRDEQRRVKNGRVHVRISEPEVTKVKPIPPEKPTSLFRKDKDASKDPTKKGFFSHFKKQKNPTTKSAPSAPSVHVEPENLKPSIKPPVPAKPVKSRKETNSSSVETTV